MCVQVYFLYMCWTVHVCSRMYMKGYLHVRAFSWKMWHVLCTWIYVYVYTYICTCVLVCYVYRWVLPCIPLRVFMNICVPVCVCKHICLCLCMCAWLYIFVSGKVSLVGFECVCMCVCVRTLALSTPLSWEECHRVPSYTVKPKSYWSGTQYGQGGGDLSDSLYSQQKFWTSWNKGTLQICLRFAASGQPSLKKGRQASRPTEEFLLDLPSPSLLLGYRPSKTQFIFLTSWHTELHSGSWPRLPSYKVLSVFWVDSVLSWSRQVSLSPNPLLCARYKQPHLLGSVSPLQWFINYSHSFQMSLLHQGKECMSICRQLE